MLLLSHSSSWRGWDGLCRMLFYLVPYPPLCHRLQTVQFAPHHTASLPHRRVDPGPLPQSINQPIKSVPLFHIEISLVSIAASYMHQLVAALCGVQSTIKGLVKRKRFISRHNDQHWNYQTHTLCAAAQKLNFCFFCFLHLQKQTFAH